MRFGIFYEHQIPRPWGDDGVARLVTIEGGRWRLAAVYD